MDVLGYTADGSIRVSIDGAVTIVPDEMRNRLRREIAAWEAAGNTIPVYAAPHPRDTASLSREGFAEACAEAGIITWDEAALWATGSALPAVASALVTAAPLDEQGPLTYKLKTVETVRRLAPEVLAIQQSLGLTDEAVDALFGI